MDRAELVGLLYRAARSKRRYGGAVVLRHVAQVENRRNRLMRRTAEQSGSFLRFMDRSEPPDWQDSRREFPDGGGEYTAWELLRPAWLLSGWELTITGEDATGVRVTVSSRPAGRDSLVRSDLDGALSHREALVDPELGILLRLNDYFEGELRRTAELLDISELPGTAAEPGGGDGAAGEIGFKVPAAVRLVARGIGAALGGAIRLETTLRTFPTPEPDDEPWFGPDADPADLQGRPVPAEDELLARLYDGPRGRAPFTVRLECWQDGKALADRFPELDVGPLTGVLGPGPMWTAIGEAAPGKVHLAHRAVVTDLVHYRVETLRGGSPKNPRIVACDGTTQYRLFPDRLVTAAAAPPDLSLTRMIDPSWLLAHAELTAHGWTGLAGRRALRLTARQLRRDMPHPAFVFPHLELLLDDEFGVLLRLTAFQGEESGRAGSPVARIELRELRTADPHPEDFRIGPPANGRTITDTGGPLGDRALPAPLKAAAGAAATLAGGMVLLTGILGRSRKPQ
ncbi:MAG TPA: hypothetical protein VGX23_30325 [Actinocrinis sp.]|nr:hypothetical protein [Actinocrinis sp.]